MSEARALRDQLSTPGARAAYKAKLPANAQDEGQVVIHHSGTIWGSSFQSVASYDVIAGRSTLSFDADALPLTAPQ